MSQQLLLAVLNAVKGPVCDDCLYRPAGYTTRQGVRAAGLTLAARGQILRGDGMCAGCGRYKTVSAALSLAARAPARPRAAPASPLPASSPPHIGAVTRPSLTPSSHRATPPMSTGDRVFRTSCCAFYGFTITFYALIVVLIVAGFLMLVVVSC